MMSITKRSRILAVALVVAMIMSLVPMMTAAAGTKYVGTAKISYATDNSMVTYTIEAPYFNADGSDAEGSVNVKISCESESMFYYDTITAANGKLTFTVAMASGDPAEKYTVQYLSDDLAVPATAVYYYSGSADHTAEIAHFDSQLTTPVKTFADVEVWEKAAVTPAAEVVNKYLISNTYDYSMEYVTDAINNIKGENPPVDYAAATFASDIDKAAIVGLFNAIDSSTPNYNTLIFTLLQDTDIRYYLEPANENAPTSYTKLSDVIAQAGKQTKFMTNFLSGGFGTFTSVADIAQKFSSAVTEATKTTQQNNGQTTITGGGGYTPSPVPVISVENVFKDINAQEYWWLLEPLQALYQNGFINGRTADTFAPGESITRAEFLKILLLELNMVDKEAKANFSDVSENDWFYAYVASGAKSGIVKGMDANTFAPNALITRQEICVMTMRAVRAKAMSLGIVSTDAKFTDQQQIADWAVDDVLSLKQAGIISGRDTGAFDPGASATRAEAVKILYGVYVKR